MVACASGFAAGVMVPMQYNEYGLGGEAMVGTSIIAGSCVGAILFFILDSNMEKHDFKLQEVNNASKKEDDGPNEVETLTE